ncbi:MAG: hypothetical protein HYZ53_19725 [Planctomycetes bacterium]|nr:hypothetical protein [Planctomycetota bacterium]
MAIPQEKADFVRQFLQDNPGSKVSAIQKALKKQFGSGVNFVQMGELCRKYNPNYQGPARTGRKRPGRPAGAGVAPRGRGRGRGGRRGRPAAASSKAAEVYAPRGGQDNGVLLVVGEAGTIYPTRAEAVKALNQSFKDGAGAGDVRLYHLIPAVLKVQAVSLD